MLVKQAGCKVGPVKQWQPWMEGLGGAQDIPMDQGLQAISQESGGASESGRIFPTL